MTYGRARDEFCIWLDSWPGADRVTVSDLNDQAWDIRSALSLLWGSEDILPSVYCDILDIEQGSTYGEAVEKVAGEMKLPMEEEQDEQE